MATEGSLTMPCSDDAPVPGKRKRGDKGGARDLLAEARRTRILIMRGKGGRGAQTRLAACNAILGGLEELTDEQLAAEMRRRLDAKKEPKP